MRCVGHLILPWPSFTVLNMEHSRCSTWSKMASSPAPPSHDAEKRSEASIDIGVALSGGGHRAALFGLGALLYLAHGRDADGKAPTSGIKLIASVSGGSITNAFLAQVVDLPTATASEVTEAARKLASQIALRGTLFATWHAWCFLGVLGICVAPSATVLIAGIFHPVSAAQIWAAVIGLLLAGILLQARGRAFARALTTVLFSDGTGRATTLADMNRARKRPEMDGAFADREFRQVLCGTEVQTGRPVYFSRSGIECAPFEIPAVPDDVPIATAVQASAALPIAFPPRSFSARFRGMGGWGGRKPDHAVVVDGGVRDNLAVELFVAQHGIRPPSWRPPISRTIVVCGAANRLKRGYLRRSLPFLGELASLWRVSNFPYDTRERAQRRMLETKFNSTDSPSGSVVHIEETPAEIAAAVIEFGENWMWQSTPPDQRQRSHHVHRFYAERVHGIPGVESAPSNDIAGDIFWHHTDRAFALLNVLARAEGLPLGRAFPDPTTIAAGKFERSPGFSTVVNRWQQRTMENASVPTNLSSLGVDVSSRLLWHGFALTMARMHLLWGYPLLDVTRQFFVDLALGKTPSAEMLPRLAATQSEALF